MGLRGPAPKPRALAIAEGNPGKRPLNGFEPEPRRKRPKCPDYLDDEAKREWRRLVPILERMRVLTEADGLALAGLCMQYSTMVKAQRLREKSGLLFRTQIRLYPAVSVGSSRGGVPGAGHETLPGLRIDAGCPYEAHGGERSQLG